MSTTRPRSRLSRAASSTGWLLPPPAARYTWSTPYPSVSSATAASTAAAPGSPQETAPRRSASAQRSGSGSAPTTRTPEAVSNCTTSCPISPSPMTSATSPSRDSPWRTPWSAIEPTVPKAACRGARPSGTGA